MATAPLPAGLSTQPRQAGGARFFRRLGGAVREAVAGGAALVRRLRRPAATRSSRNPPEPHNPAAPRPHHDPAAPPAPRPRRPRPTALVQPARAGWLARWFGRKRQPARRPIQPDGDDIPFTPETHPGLSPEACAFFNTPLEDLDSDMLRVVLAALVTQIADHLPPELGMDRQALLACLTDKLCAAPETAGPDTPPPASQDADPPAPPSLPRPAAEPAPADAAALAPPVAADTARDTAAPTGAALRHRRARVAASRPHLRRRSGPRRRVPSRPPRLPARRLCYAACAGPP